MADKRLRVIVEAVTSQAQAAFKSMGNTVSQFASQAARGLGGVIGAGKQLYDNVTSLEGAVKAAMNLMAVHYAKMAVDAVTSMAEMAAKNLELGEGFRTVADRMGIDADELVQRLKEAARETIGTYQTMGLAIKALDLGMAASTDDLVKLMEIAHVRAKRYGMSTAEAFQLLIDGISSGRPMMLRHLGFLADTEQAYDRVARSMGKDADELTLLQQKQAVFQAILETGQPDLEAWVNTADDATDVFARNEVATAKLRQEWGERFLPAIVAVKQELTNVLGLLSAMGDPIGAQQQHLADLVETEGTMRAATIAYAKELVIANRGRLDYNEALVQAKAAMEGYVKAEEAANWGQMYQDSARARLATERMGDAAEDTTQDLDKLADAQKIAGDYTRAAGEEFWRYSQRVDDARFSMQQAAEQALFDLMKVERDAGDRRSDLLETENIQNEAETARHNNQLRYLKEDLMDSLADIEWEYQRERREAMDKAPWWIRNALQKEFAERERIARTGDKKALAAYDKMLLERIRAIDPAYAKELELMQEQHEHEEKIEKREGKQSLDRQEDDWEISERQEQRSLDHQLDVLSRELQQQRDEWAFNAGQRAESETRAMDQLGVEYAHSLMTLKETTALKLAELPPIYEQYGYASWAGFIAGWSRGISETPLNIPAAGGGGTSPGPKHYQAGAWNVPRNQLAFIDRGEMVIPAGPAKQIREGGGGVSITIQHLSVSGGRAGAREFVKAVEDEMGKNIRGRTR